MTTISMPLFIIMGWKYKNRKPVLDKLGNKIPKKYHLNLNSYRNWHYLVSNKLKQLYKEIAYDRMRGEDLEAIANPVRLTFVLHRGDKRRIDRSNVLSVHEKFFCDALVELDYIGDDNDDYIVSSHYYSEGVDKDNPRVDITIQEVL